MKPAYDPLLFTFRTSSYSCRLPFCVHCSRSNSYYSLRLPWLKELSRVIATGWRSCSSHQLTFGPRFVANDSFGAVVLVMGDMSYVRHFLRTQCRLLLGSTVPIKAAVCGPLTFSLAWTALPFPSPLKLFGGCITVRVTGGDSLPLRFFRCSLRRGKTPKRKAPSKTRQDNQDPVEVYCRIRPLANQNDVSIVRLIDNKVVQLNPLETCTPSRNATKQASSLISILWRRLIGTCFFLQYRYTFKYVFDASSSQEEVFEQVGLPLVSDLIHGRPGMFSMASLFS